MSTLVVVRKNRLACMAADTLTCFEDQKQPASYVARPEKIFRFGESLVGAVGPFASEAVLESVIAKESAPPAFESRLEIFEYFRRLHPALKEEYFINPKDEQDAAFESSQLNLLIANRHGIFGVWSFREVMEFRRFWAMGSGSSYALGAMQALYERAQDAEEIARGGVAAGAEFDTGTGLPLNSFTVRLDVPPPPDPDLV